jgi:phage N-6-adenine-methyltransferase
VNTGTLFPLAADDVATTTDDWYTPRWIFDAIGFTFDTDAAAPVLEESRTVPARRYLTILDDGLASEWVGTTWCNPPYSKAAPWVEKWAQHPDGMILVPAMPEVKWLGRLLLSADAMTVIAVDFLRPGKAPCRLPWSMILAARGEPCIAALARVAAADRYAAGGYLRGVS